MDSQGAAANWQSRLAAAPRLSGQVQLTSYDAAVRHLVITQYLEYEGLLPVEALQEGLMRAVSAFPVVLAWIEQRADGAMLLRWDSSAAGSRGGQRTFHWNVCVRGGPAPSIWSDWQLRLHGAFPRTHGRLAAAKVTVYPDANKSLLLFSFKHVLFDYSGAHMFLELWLREAAAAAAAARGSGHIGPSRAAGPELAVDLEAALPANPARFDRGPYQQPASLAVRPGSSSGSSTGQSRVEGSAKQQQAATAAAAAVAAMQHEEQQQQQQQQTVQQAALPQGWDIPTSRQECLQWLQQHRSGDSCPFQWDPFDRAVQCEMAWRVLPIGLAAQRAIFTIPAQLLQQSKAVATAACPLPPGMHYSSVAAASALLVATLYCCDSKLRGKAGGQGGLHVTSVVDVRGGRCGMSIPHSSATNASVWGVRTWVPQHLLDTAAAAAVALNATDGSVAAAAGPRSSSSSSIGGSRGAASTAAVVGVCPELMHHLRLDLDRQLRDPGGNINKQFEWFEVARRAGQHRAVRLAQVLQQVQEGDIVLDCLRDNAGQLPAPAGCCLTAASVRWLPGYSNYMVMASPVTPPAATAAAASSAATGAAVVAGSGAAGAAPGPQGVYDIQVEVNVPCKSANQLWCTWRHLGLTQVSIPSKGNAYNAASAAAAAAVELSQPGHQAYQHTRQAQSAEPRRYVAGGIHSRPVTSDRTASCSPCNAAQPGSPEDGPTTGHDGIPQPKFGLVVGLGGGSYWQPLDFFVCPGALYFIKHVLLGYLPWLLLRWLKSIWGRQPACDSYCSRA